ncbi:MAG: 3-hydroxyacyl-CoA dehydrogenase NAD-binding domain-containing protein [Bacteroidetes bacterium]|nr:3-hydroxyacyl-CoA dehydrogenase NAD-binding domain-containing protein [Bacteroidota bacterium]MDA0859819.1 3-hydroxyacyl-CoA dehydrogenase NAD-binding domain-containing protein [Bacteroidota bacterium]MDA1317595.1 3-hydroxyacyl-CoA dehydrogenase NAD-binding domain-containing protein [Bacteroidota bacterium]
MKNIAVIGAGTMGNGIAHTFAQNGYRVQLIDVNETALSNAIQTITKNLDRMVQKEVISEAKKAQTLDNITAFSNIVEGVEYASLVVEAATENEALKLSIFKTLDEACPEDTILATNTSSISITKIASVTSRPNQVIGMHFMNPVPIMPLIEIINGYNTEKEVTDFIVELTKKIGKTPVLANDFPGFVANRILMPMINEAIETLQCGVSGVVEIDTIMKLGMAHPMGPLELADFIGLDVCLSILEVMYDGFKNPKYAPNPLLVNMVRAGKLGKKTGEGFYNYSTERKAVVPSAQFL